MLFNDEVMFLHVPKTGGMSITTYLLNNLPGTIYLSLPPAAFDHARRSAVFPDVHDRLQLVGGTRHEDLLQAERIASEFGRRLQDFKLIMAAMRNPYDLEVSYYCHLRKESVRQRSGKGRRAATLAAGDFETFAQKAPYYGHLPSRIERYYSLPAGTPDNLQKMRLEDIDGELAVLAPYSLRRWSMRHQNRTNGRRQWRDYITPTAESAIYEKYHYLFNFYPREIQVAGTS